MHWSFYNFDGNSVQFLADKYEYLIMLDVIFKRDPKKKLERKKHLKGVNDWENWERVKAAMRFVE